MTLHKSIRSVPSLKSHAVNAIFTYFKPEVRRGEKVQISLSRLCAQGSGVRPAEDEEGIEDEQRLDHCGYLARSNLET